MIIIIIIVIIVDIINREPFSLSRKILTRVHFEIREDDTIFSRIEEENCREKINRIFESRIFKRSNL